MGQNMSKLVAQTRPGPNMGSPNPTRARKKVARPSPRKRTTMRGPPILVIFFEDFPLNMFFGAQSKETVTFTPTKRLQMCLWAISWGIYGYVYLYLVQCLDNQQKTRTLWAIKLGRKFTKNCVIGIHIFCESIQLRYFEIVTAIFRFTTYLVVRQCAHLGT